MMTSSEQDGGVSLAGRQIARTARTAQNFYRIACLLLALVPGLAGAATLSGVVTNEQGSPVEGAKVMPATAAVREGTSPLCPSCYPDCAKSATTDASGRFIIADVDDALLFNLLVAAPEYRAAYARRSDPRKGDIKVTLAKAKPDSMGIRGKVLDPEGRPVFGALVEPNGYSKGKGTSYGGFPGDQMAVTDRDGNFELICTKTDVERIGVNINAPQLARRAFEPLPIGQNIHEYRLDRGVNIQGRLVRGGKGVPKANVTIVQQNRSAGEFLGIQTIGTDIDGKFEFANVPAGEIWALSACRDTLPENAVTASVPVMSTAPDAAMTVGDLVVEDGIVIEGRVRLVDDKPVPPNTRVLFDREMDWDPQTRILDAEGRFHFAARAGDQMTFYARVPGYTDQTRVERGMATGAKLDVTPQTTSIDIVLERKGEPAAGKTLTGVVRTSDGQAATDAKVYLLLPENHLVIENGALAPHSRAFQEATTDAQGRYALRGSFSESPKLITLLVLHESGWAEVPFADQATIDLTPWAAVEGTARLGNKLLAGQTVKITFPRFRDETKASPFFQATATTNDKGAFKIDHAVPGIGRIGVVSGKKDFREVYFQQVGVELFPGKTTRLDLGGTGATVKGRIAIPSEVRERSDIKDAVGRMNRYEEGSRRPADPKEAAAINKQRNLTLLEYGFDIAPDGTFEIHDVATGTFTLSATFPGKGPREFSIAESAGFFATQFVVPPGEKEIEVKDGKFQINKEPLKVGNKLPEFTAQSTSGRSITSDSFKGRTGVVIFALEESDASQIQALGSLPSDAKPFILWVAQRPRKSQAAAGGETVTGADAHTVTQAFGIQSWPTYYVISRDGTIVARERMADDAVRAITKALAAGK